jgi:hypothetical protein
MKKATTSARGSKVASYGCGSRARSTFQKRVWGKCSCHKTCQRPMVRRSALNSVESSCMARGEGPCRISSEPDGCASLRLTAGLGGWIGRFSGLRRRRTYSGNDVRTAGRLSFLKARMLQEFANGRAHGSSSWRWIGRLRIVCGHGRSAPVDSGCFGSSFSAIARRIGPRFVSAQSKSSIRPARRVLDSGSFLPSKARSSALISLQLSTASPAHSEFGSKSDIG